MGGEIGDAALSLSSLYATEKELVPTSWGPAMGHFCTLFVASRRVFYKRHHQEVVRSWHQEEVGGLPVAGLPAFSVLALCHHVDKTWPGLLCLAVTWGPSTLPGGHILLRAGGSVPLPHVLDPCPVPVLTASSGNRLVSGASCPGPGPGRGLVAVFSCSVVGSSVFQDGPVGVHAGAGSWARDASALAGRCRVSLGRRGVEKVHGTYFMEWVGGGKFFLHPKPSPGLGLAGHSSSWEPGRWRLVLCGPGGGRWVDGRDFSTFLHSAPTPTEPFSQPEDPDVNTRPVRGSALSDRHVTMCLIPVSARE